MIHQLGYLHIPFQSLFNIHVRTAVVDDDNVHLIITCLTADPGYFIDKVLRPTTLVLHG